MDHKALDVIGVEESSGDVFSEVAGSKTSSSSSSQDKKSEMKGSENGDGDVSEGNVAAEKNNTTIYREKEEQKTFNKNHPISEFLRLQKGMIDSGISQEEFAARYDKFCEENGYENDGAFANQQLSVGEGKDNFDVSGGSSKDGSYKQYGNLKKIVLKFTTLSESGYDAPSFTVGTTGARVGRDMENEVSVPSDVKLAPMCHATIKYRDGFFYLVDSGLSFGAGIRITTGSKHWELVRDAFFSAGTSIFRSTGIEKVPGGDDALRVEVMEGPLKGEIMVIGKGGGSIGRSSDNSICIPDKELSRKHSAIVFDERTGKFFIQDVGSTNGTYMLLTGANKGPYRLNLNDHIVVGRTGFSINRYDYGIAEEIGYRQTMEDSCVIVQDLGVIPLCRSVQDQYAPQSFFGVFDGHGGANASKYLSKHLHVNVADGLAAITPDILKTLEYTRDEKMGSDEMKGEGGYTTQSEQREIIDNLVKDMLKSTFLQTDKSFLTESEHCENGSTATTVLLLGQRLYCANVGDSRSLLCRKFKPFALSEDHKPSREDEAKRIRDSGGFVINNRVMGELAVSRAFGDSEFKKGIQSIIQEEGIKVDAEETTNWDDPLIIAEPEFVTTTLTPDDQFLVLACDGLFDVFTPADLIDYIKNFLEKNGGDVQKCTQSLTYEAIRKRNSRDNVSVILILLNKWF